MKIMSIMPCFFVLHQHMDIWHRKCRRLTLSTIMLTLTAHSCLNPSFTLHPSSLLPPPMMETPTWAHTQDTHMYIQRKRCCRRSPSLTLAPSLIIFPDHFQHCMPVATSCFQGIYFLLNHTEQSLLQTQRERHRSTIYRTIGTLTSDGFLLGQQVKQVSSCCVSISLLVPLIYPGPFSLENMGFSSRYTVCMNSINIFEKVNTTHQSI